MSKVPVLDSTIQKTHEWLKDITDGLGFPNQQSAFAALRATPHTLRDRLPREHAAQLSGDTLGSTCLDFAPQAPVASGNYVFDVSLAREGGSAGAVMMVLQTVLLPLAFAEGDSEVALHGGTHMAWSPPFDYVRDVWLPVLSRLGVEASVELANWGWYPVGKGEVRAGIRGLGGHPAMLRRLEL